jgi:CoA:oxalate CoA-transferase
MSSLDSESQHDSLKGLVVLDFTLFMAGPLCTRILADAGADVIKVEGPEGDIVRLSPPMLRSGFSTYFASLNCGKRSIVLDLATSEGRKIAVRLAAKADVLVENFRPGVAQRLGIDFATLRAINPRLIYCSISGFGQTGPKSTSPAYAPIINACTGYETAHMEYQDDVSRPANVGIMIGDVLGGLHAASAIKLALFDRERTGKGQGIDVALFDSVLGILFREIQEAQRPTGHRSRGFQPVRARDGYLMVAAVTPRNTTAMFDVINRPECKMDPRFATPAAKSENATALLDMLEEWAREKSAKECEEALMAAGVPCSRYKTVAEAMDDIQTVERGTMHTLSMFGESLQIANLPYKMTSIRTEVRPTLPQLGEHTSEVLCDMLDLDPETLAHLKSEGAFGRFAKAA